MGRVHSALSGSIPTALADRSPNALTVLDLFSGIGGFSLGLERAGMKTVAFCEINPFGRAVLAKHWPEVPCYDDVCTLTSERLAADGVGPIDVICGGFPCQDISDAGNRAGLAGERSGLWSEIVRLARELRPGWLIVENVAALLGRGLDIVLGDLAEIGYDAEWHCIPASAIGAPHRRDRVWIVAYAQSAQRRADLAPCGRVAGPNSIPQRQEGSGRSAPGRADVADAERWGLQGGHEQRAGAAAIIPAAFGRHCGGREFGAPWWSEPDVGRVAHGVPHGMDRLAALGNAVVPQIPEILGRAIMSARAALQQRDAA